MVVVRNLPINITESRLGKLFEHHGKIIKMIIPHAKDEYQKSRYGFIHFAESSSARRALDDTKIHEIDGRSFHLYLVSTPLIY